MIGHLFKRKEPMPMYVTYDDLFTFVLMLCAVITLVLTYKKQRPHPGKVEALFFIKYCNSKTGRPALPWLPVPR